MSKILVTGASGYLGSSLCLELVNRGYSVVGSMRTPQDKYLFPSVYAELTPDFDWSAALKDVSVVIHCAAHVHIFRSDMHSAHDLFHEINVLGTLNLAVQAKEAGIRRFIFISTIGVNGDTTLKDCAFSESDIPRPNSDYSRSKLKAELLLTSLVSQGDMDLVIVRPPLIYGPNAPGHYRILSRLIGLGIPLPLSAANSNLRSFISLHNLVDLIIFCIFSKDASNEIFLAADGEDISTIEFICLIGKLTNRKPILFYVQPKLLLKLATFFNLQGKFFSLFGNLQISTQKINNLLGWSPAIKPSSIIKKDDIQIELI